MSLRLRETIEREWILIHDFYSESSEPDAPRSKFQYLNKTEQQEAASQYSSDNFKAVLDGDTLVGFVGFFPDDHDNVNIFYVISPVRRGHGYFSKLLALSLEYCRKEFVGFKYIRVLTRKQNTSSIKGLERFSFHRRGTVVEEVQPDVTYEEYLLPI
ncbi:MAG: GNAT family N-acetyltransferase [Bdellovibrio sp.]